LCGLGNTHRRMGRWRPCTPALCGCLRLRTDRYPSHNWLLCRKDTNIDNHDCEPDASDYW
jgi:hypothetical protein